MSAGDLRGPALAALLLLLAGIFAHAAEPPVPGSSTKCTDDACLRCSPDGSRCVECESAYGLDSSGQCIRCNVTGEHGDRCGRCNSDRPDFCLECAPIITQKVGNLGFYATADGQCAPCPDHNCANCTSLTGACTACNNYYGAVDGACLPCVDRRCRHCDGNLDWCTMCMNHVADPTTGRCLNCTDPHCVACEIDFVGSCSDCNRGYTLDGKGGCAPCAKGCDHCSIAGGGKCDDGSCKPGWGYVASGSTCVHCSTNCTDCTSETQCRSCLDGLSVWKGACKSCGAGCQVCTFDDEGQPLCNFCGEGGLDAATKACVPCKEAHCAGCVDDPTICLGCEYGYRLTESNSCEPCAMANCDFCSADAARCEAAALGYRTADAGGTEACAVPHCVTCENSKDTCDSCGVGFGLDSNTTSCVACPPNCDACPESKSTCVMCAVGFYLNDTTWLCEQCQPGDATTHFECETQV